MEPKQINKIIQFLFLAVAWISVLCCLVRTDYNFAFALFGYYLWISRDDKANSSLLMIMNGVLIFVDLIWLLAVGGIWTTWLKNNKVWDDMHGLHVFALFMSVINLIVKIILTYCINLYKPHQNTELTQVAATK